MRARVTKNYWGRVFLSLALAASLGAAAPAIAQDQPAANNGSVVITTTAPPVRIGSRWIASTFLNNEGGQLQNTVIELGWVSSMWTIDKLDGDKVHIRSVWKSDQYLKVEGGALTAGPVADAAASQWVMEPVGRGFYVRFKNVANPELYINVAEGKLQASPIQPESLSADWWILK